MGADAVVVVVPEVELVALPEVELVVVVPDVEVVVGESVEEVDVVLEDVDVEALGAGSRAVDVEEVVVDVVVGADVDVVVSVEVDVVDVVPDVVFVVVDPVPQSFPSTHELLLPEPGVA